MSGERILIVDDEDTIRNLFKDVLEDEGYSTATAANAGAALGLLADERYDLVVTDLKMPGMGGIEFIQRIKEQYDDIVIIVMTGYATVETARAVTKEGAYDYIIKPCDVSEIRESIDNALARHRLEKEKIRNKELLDLFKISELMSSTIDFEPLLNLIMTLILDQTNASKGILLISSAEQDGAFRVVCVKDAECLDAGNVFGHQSLYETVVKNGQPALISCLEHHPLAEMVAVYKPHPEESASSRYSSGQNLVIPLKYQNRVVGVLCAIRDEGARPFSEFDLEISQILGTQAAISIENARLYSEIHKKMVELKESNKQLQEAQYQLIQAGRLATVGELAGGVAHEIGNPLFAISGIIEILLQRAEKESFTSKTVQYLKAVHKQIVRVQGIANNLLKFARGAKVEKTALKINDIVAEVVSILNEQLIKNKIVLNTELDQNIPQIVGDGNQLQQVVLNLLINAKDAMPEGGRISIKTTYRQDKQCVELSFSDTGCGIAPDILDKIFDPFFTTKKVGKGTGLGLSVSYGIIKQHKGDITVCSSLNQGTTFFVTLPVPVNNGHTAEEISVLASQQHGCVS